MTKENRRTPFAIGDVEWRILCTACGENPWYFNVANLVDDWTGGAQTTASWRRWYKPLIMSVKHNYIKAYIDHYTPTKRNPNLFNISFIEVDKIDFRRRMHFRATPKGWGAYHRSIRAGRKRPVFAKSGGYWVVENELTGETWKEDGHGNRIE